MFNGLRVTIWDMEKKMGPGKEIRGIGNWEWEYILCNAYMVYEKRTEMDMRKEFHVEMNKEYLVILK